MEAERRIFLCLRRRALVPPLTPEMPRYSLYGITVDSAIDLRATPAPIAATVDCTVRLTADVTAPDVDWFHAWRFPRCPPALLFGRVGDGYILRVPGVADATVSADGAAVGVHAGLPRDSAQHLLADLVLPLAASRQRDLLLHASSVHLPDIGAIGFAGPSGRGKSSLAAALVTHGASVMSDDCTPIGQTQDSPTALPGYPGLRLWPDVVAGLASRAGGESDGVSSGKVRVGSAVVPFFSRPCNIRAIFILSRRHRGCGLKLRRVSHRAAVVQLMRHAFIMDIEDRSQLARVFTALTSLVARVPILRLALEDDPDALSDAAASVIRLAASIARDRRAAPAA